MNQNPSKPELGGVLLKKTNYLWDQMVDKKDNGVLPAPNCCQEDQCVTTYLD